jgi:hypothetical protein
VAKSVKPVFHSTPGPRTAVSGVPWPDEIGLARNMPSDHSSCVGAVFSVPEIEDRVRLKKFALPTRFRLARPLFGKCNLQERRGSLVRFAF